MTKRLTRIAPWQAGKLFALIYFATSFIFVIPMALVTTFAPMPPGPGTKIGPAMLMLLPFLYALGGLILVPIGCAIYNLAAKFAGGLEVTVTDGA
jgi:hypothetical protein